MKDISNLRACYRVGTVIVLDEVQVSSLCTLDGHTICVSGAPEVLSLPQQVYAPLSTCEVHCSATKVLPPMAVRRVSASMVLPAAEVSTEGVPYFSIKLMVSWKKVACARPEHVPCLVHSCSQKES